jgi:hypothetical protein
LLEEHKGVNTFHLLVLFLVKYRKNNTKLFFITKDSFIGSPNCYSKKERSFNGDDGTWNSDKEVDHLSIREKDYGGCQTFGWLGEPWCLPIALRSLLGGYVAFGDYGSVFLAGD